MGPAKWGGALSKPEEGVPIIPDYFHVPKMKVQPYRLEEESHNYSDEEESLKKREKYEYSDSESDSSMTDSSDSSDSDSSDSDSSDLTDSDDDDVAVEATSDFATRDSLVTLTSSKGPAYSARMGGQGSRVGMSSIVSGSKIDTQISVGRVWRDFLWQFFKGF